MDDLLALFKALSDETRLRLIVLLAKREHCVCELTEILSLPQPRVSSHLAKLKALGVVRSRRESQFIHYSLALEDEAVRRVVAVLRQQAHHYGVLREDDARVPLCTR